jgi:hypothetical protein
MALAAHGPFSVRVAEIEVGVVFAPLGTQTGPHGPHRED